MQPLYNQEGRAVAYIADNEVSVYLYDGGPAGWIHQGCVYAYSGRFLGWMMYGWLCDPEGYPAFFTDRSQGGPRRPPRQARPARGPREFRPQRALRWGRPSRPGMKTGWSRLSDESFFASTQGDEIAGSENAAETGKDEIAASGDAAETGHKDEIAGSEDAAETAQKQEE